VRQCLHKLPNKTTGNPSASQFSAILERIFRYIIEGALQWGNA
jgi:hypothetical protein